VVHWTQKYNQGVHENYHIHFYGERYEIIAIPINSDRCTDFDLKN